MPNHFVVIFVSGFFALVGIRILISSFDDDDNDGDGMTYPSFNDYSLSTEWGAWDLEANLWDYRVSNILIFISKF